MYVDLLLKLNENAFDWEGKYKKMQNDPPQGRFAFNFASLKPFGQNNSTKI